MARAKPHLHWLSEARTALNADPEFRKLGSADFRLGLVLGDETRIVSFEAFEVAEVAEADPGDMRDADIVLEMAPREWNAYLRQRAKGRGETLLSMDTSEQVVKARNPLKRLTLERYNRTIQTFIDKGATLAATA